LFIVELAALYQNPLPTQHLILSCSTFRNFRAASLPWMWIIPWLLWGASMSIALWQWATGLFAPLHKPYRPTGRPRLSILKPLRGNEKGINNCLESWAAQPYDGEYEVLFGTSGEAGESRRAAEELARAFPDKVKLIDAEQDLCVNAKVSTLSVLESISWW
jgi:hypothetical protein